MSKQLYFEVSEIRHQVAKLAQQHTGLPRSYGWRKWVLIVQSLAANVRSNVGPIATSP